MGYILYNKVKIEKGVNGDYIGMFSLSDGEMFEGDISFKEQKLVKAFVLKYGKELLKMWETQEFSKLDPIEE